MGCGAGQASFMLARAGFEVMGTDCAPSAIELANKNLHEENLTNVSFETGDIAQGLKYPDESFDLIVDNHVFHCLVDLRHRKKFLSEIKRLLKPGGVIFSTNMSSHVNHLPELIHQGKAQPRGKGYFTDNRYFTDKDETIKDFQRAGLKIEFIEANGDITVYARKV